MFQLGFGKSWLRGISVGQAAQSLLEVLGLPAETSPGFRR